MSQFSALVGEHASKIPSLLQVSEFFLARAPEVVKLYESMDIKNPRIPNHKRRRVKSYKPYWINPKPPKRVSGPRVMVSRRTKRRKRLYLNPAEKKRLPLTHVWHAKRFHMEEVWNMRLPTIVSDKGPRAIMRHAKECLLHDKSYMDCWTVEIASGNRNQLVSSLRDSEVFSGSLCHPKVTSGEFVGCGDITKNRALLSPYQAIWKVDGLDIWTHPSGRNEVEEIMMKINAVLQVDRIRFELLGKRAPNILSDIGLNTTFPSIIPGKLVRAVSGENECQLLIRGGGELVDVFFATSGRDSAWNSWLSLVHRGASPVGIYNRHEFLTARYLSPEFPFDFPLSKAGARQTALHAKAILEIDQKRPKQCKMNAVSVESPFFPDWSLLGSTQSLTHVSVHVVDKGSISWNAHIYLNEILVGFITSVGGDYHNSAVGSIAATMHTPVSEYLIRNPGSDRLIKVQVNSCQFASVDSLVLGFSRPSP